MKKNVLLLVFFLTVFICAPVFSQENAGTLQGREDQLQQARDYSLDQIFVINSFEYIVEGYTRPFALNNKAEIYAGEEITGLSNLERFIREKRQILYNERVLERVRIEYTIGEAGSDGKYPVDLLIYVKDTWNIIAIPRPQYSSNTGFDITIKARDYNFLGTMSPLRFDIGYQRDQDGRNFFSLMLDTDIPFRLFGYNWNLDFDHDYTYRPDSPLPHYYKNTTGISIDFPVRRTTLTVGFSESFIYNQENPNRYKDPSYGYGNYQEGLYLESKPFISWKIPAGFHYYDLGEVYYTPGLSVTFVHELSKWPLDDFRKGPFIDFSHNMSFGRIDWVGNFQKGASAIISNSWNYNFYHLRNDENPWNTNITVKGTGHTIINNYVGISSRIMYRHWFFDYYHDEAGDVLRGILDNRVKANYMFSFNFDLNIRTVKFLPSEWNIGEKSRRFMRIFDFELHTVPFVDAALYNDPLNQRVFGLENLLLTGGLELVVFPARWRSLFLRVSYGRNFSLGPKRNASEIFIGTELHY